MGVVKYGTFCVFVKDMAVGDEGEIVVTALRKDYGYGRLLKLEKAGEGRCEPVCPISRQCGGCQLQHLSYEEQLRFKQGIVQNNIERIAGLDVTINPIIGARKQFEYRNKCMLPCESKDGNTVIGFYRFNSHDIIPLEKCYLQSEEANLIVQDIKGLSDHFGLSQLIRHVMIRDMENSGQIMVVIVTWKDETEGVHELAEELVKKHSRIVSVIQSINSADTNVVLGKEERVLYGRDRITDELMGLTFSISSHSFYQVNSAQTAVLYSEALKMAKLSKNDTVIDLYCGVGTIGMAASREAGKVIGVEIVPSAVDNARENAHINHISNIEFICADASQAAQKFVREGIKADVVFVDPPRKGCDSVTLEAIGAIGPQRIVYVSCNPATLARDLKYLDGHGYQVEEIQPVDQFAQTYHVETVCSLVKRESI